MKRGEWDSNPWAILGESILFVKKLSVGTKTFWKKEELGCTTEANLTKADK